MKNQHSAVIEATKSVMGEKFQNGVDIKSYITEGDRAKVIELVTDGFLAGEIEMSEEARVKYSERKAMIGYVKGLVTNWFNKSKELNGGVKYEAKNPGSRAGATDPQVKEMKNLKAHLEAAGNAEGAAKVEAAIQLRLNELKAAKDLKAQPKINVENLPEELRSLVSAVDEV